MEPATVTATSAAVGLLSRVRNAIKKLRQHALAEQHKQELADIDETVTELGDRLFAQQARMLEMLAEIDALRSKISDAENWEKRLAKYKLTETAGGCFVLQSIDGDPEHFACPTCAESKHEIHHLHRANESSHSCGGCRARFATGVRVKTVVRTRPPGGGWMGR